MLPHILSLSRRSLLAAASLMFLNLASTAAFPADDHFTIAVIPDTQNYVDYSHQKVTGFPFDAKDLFMQQLKYIADNTKPRGGDIAFISGLGDIWQHQTLDIDPGHAARGFKRTPNHFMDREFAPTPKVTEVEIPSAKAGYDQIKDTVPFAVVPGNHDYDAMWTDANHPPAAEFKTMADIGMLHAGGLSNFIKAFGAKSDYFKDKPWYVASHDGGADSAQIFSAGGYKFLHIGLQFDAPNASLEWAAKIVKRYPDLPTIVTTHDYMDVRGNRLANPIIDNHAVDPQDNSPEMVWDKFISQHDQIFLVLCGHEHGQAFRTDNNRFGHKVFQILSDYQDRAQTVIDAGQAPSMTKAVGDGWFRLMRFDMHGDTPRVKVRTYSTHYAKDSRDTPDYANWYKAHEQPKLSDAEFIDQDDFSFDLTDFKQRFKPSSHKK